MYEVQHKDTILPPLPVAKRGYALNPNRSLGRLPLILGCFYRILFIFHLLVGILPVLFSQRSPPRIQE